MCREDLGWDDPINQELSQSFLSYREELKLLQEYLVPRYIVKKVPSRIDIIHFSDSSLRAYYTVVYFHAVYDDGVTTRIITSKSRVAPLKELTIHRLKLLIALLLPKLVRRVANHLLFSSMYLITNNGSVLGWSRHDVENLKQYVKNRVVKILELTCSTD